MDWLRDLMQRRLLVVGALIWLVTALGIGGFGFVRGFDTGAEAQRRRGAEVQNARVQEGRAARREAKTAAVAVADGKPVAGRVRADKYARD